MENGLELGHEPLQRSLRVEMRHRFASTDRSLIDCYRLVLWTGFPVWCLFRHGKHRVPQILYRMNDCALARAVDSALAGALPR
jgi:hypothetical protein